MTSTGSASATFISIRGHPTDYRSSGYIESTPTISLPDCLRKAIDAFAAQSVCVVVQYGMSFSDLVLPSGLPWVVIIISIVCLGTADFSTNCLGKSIPAN